MPWIVSRRYDLAFFSGSVAISFAFAGMFYGLQHFGGASVSQAVHPVRLLFFAAFDQPHIFQTAARVYGDRRQFHRVRFLATWGLLAILIGSAAFTYCNSPLFGYTLLGAFGSFHIIRQNVGFLKAYRRLGSERGLWDGRIEVGLYYLFMFGCMVRDYSGSGWRYLGLNRPGWAHFHRWIPASFGRHLFYPVLLLPLLLLAWQIFKHRRGHALNWPKLALMVSTGFTHFVLFFLMRHLPASMETAVETGYHDVQYHAWMARFQTRRFTAVKRVALKWLCGALLYGTVCAALSILPASALFRAYFRNVVLAVVLFHYIIDGYIWKFSEDRQLSGLMFSQRPLVNPIRIETPALEPTGSL